MSAAPALPLGLILAGGRGRRIGGRKAFVPLLGKPLVSHVIDRVAPQVSALAINAAPDAGFDRFDLPVLGDAVAGLGPLAGILTALEWAEREGASRVLTVAVDTPFLPPDLAARLAAGLDGAGTGAAYAVTRDGAHATTGLWTADLRVSLRATLDDGTRKVQVWTEAIGAVPVHFDDATAFLNVNTPDDLRAAEERLRR